MTEVDAFEHENHVLIFLKHGIEEEKRSSVIKL